VSRKSKHPNDINLSRSRNDQAALRGVDYLKRVAFVFSGHVPIVLERSSKEKIAQGWAHTNLAEWEQPSAIVEIARHSNNKKVEWHVPADF